MYLIEFYNQIFSQLIRIKLTSILLFIISFTLSAQNGRIRGLVTDGETGETILFGTVTIPSLNIGTQTDLDGNYDIAVAAGTYTVVFSYVGYADFKEQNVVVTSGNVTILDVKMKTETTQLQEVVITANQIRTTESAISTIKQKRQTS